MGHEISSLSRAHEWFELTCGSEADEANLGPITPSFADFLFDSEPQTDPIINVVIPDEQSQLSGTRDDFNRMSSEWDPELNPASDSYVEPADFVVSAAMTPLMMLAMHDGVAQFSDMALQSKRSEIRTQVAAIRAAEIDYFAVHGRYLAVDALSQTHNRVRICEVCLLNPALRRWAGCQDLRGTHSGHSSQWIFGSSESRTDEDGERASFTATKSIQATLNSNEDTY